MGATPSLITGKTGSTKEYKMSDNTQIQSKYTEAQLTKAMNKAKLEVMSGSSAFLSTVLFSMRFNWTPQVESICVTEGDLNINPEWFMDLAPVHREVYLAKQAYHNALMHVERRGGKVLGKWQRACNYSVAEILAKTYRNLPNEVEHDPQYDNMSVDEIYQLLEDEDGDGDGKGDGALGGANGNTPQDVPPSMTPDQSQRRKDDLAKAQANQRMSGKDAGSLPGELERLLDELFNPILPWAQLLQNRMKAYDKTDYSMRKPNRRFFPDFHLPSLYSEGMGAMAVFIDVSGSVSEDDLTVFMSEVAAIKETLNPTELRVILFDTRLQGETLFTRDDTVLDIEYRGGGGTSIHPVVDWIDENKPEVALVFTDGYYSSPQKNLSEDVIWVVYDNPNFSCEFGEVILYDKDN